MKRRQGTTVIEVLTVIGILGVLVGVLLVAVQKSRSVAVRTQSVNMLRQMMLGTAQLAEQSGGVIRDLPSNDIRATRGDDGSYTYGASGVSLQTALLPWVHGPYRPSEPPDGLTPQQQYAYLNSDVPAYRSPADPSLVHPQSQATDRKKCSYAANFQVFNRRLDLTGSDKTRLLTAPSDARIGADRSLASPLIWS